MYSGLEHLKSAGSIGGGASGGGVGGGGGGGGGKQPSAWDLRLAFLARASEEMASVSQPVSSFLAVRLRHLAEDRGMEIPASVKERSCDRCESLLLPQRNCKVRIFNPRLKVRCRRRQSRKIPSAKEEDARDGRRSGGGEGGGGKGGEVGRETGGGDNDGGDGGGNSAPSDSRTTAVENEKGGGGVGGAMETTEAGGGNLPRNHMVKQRLVPAAIKKENKNKSKKKKTTKKAKKCNDVAYTCLVCGHAGRKKGEGRGGAVVRRRCRRPPPPLPTASLAAGDSALAAPAPTGTPTPIPTSQMTATTEKNKKSKRRRGRSFGSLGDSLLTSKTTPKSHQLLRSPLSADMDGLLLLSSGGGTAMAAAAASSPGTPLLRAPEECKGERTPSSSLSDSTSLKKTDVRTGFALAANANKSKIKPSICLGMQSPLPPLRFDLACQLSAPPASSTDARSAALASVATRNTSSSAAPAGATSLSSAATATAPSVAAPAAAMSSAAAPTVATLSEAAAPSLTPSVAVSRDEASPPAVATSSPALVVSTSFLGRVATSASTPLDATSASAPLGATSTSAPLGATSAAVPLGAMSASACIATSAQSLAPAATSAVAPVKSTSGPPRSVTFDAPVLQSGYLDNNAGAFPLATSAAPSVATSATPSGDVVKSELGGGSEHQALLVIRRGTTIAARLDDDDDDDDDDDSRIGETGIGVAAGIEKPTCIERMETTVGDIERADGVTVVDESADEAEREEGERRGGGKSEGKEGGGGMAGSMEQEAEASKVAGKMSVRLNDDNTEDAANGSGGSVEGKREEEMQAEEEGEGVRVGDVRRRFNSWEGVEGRYGGDQEGKQQGDGSAAKKTELDQRVFGASPMDTDTNEEGDRDNPSVRACLEIDEDGNGGKDTALDDGDDRAAVDGADHRAKDRKEEEEARRVEKREGFRSANGTDKRRGHVANAEGKERVEGDHREGESLKQVDRKTQCAAREQEEEVGEEEGGEKWVQADLLEQIASRRKEDEKEEEEEEKKAHVASPRQYIGRGGLFVEKMGKNQAHQEEEKGNDDRAVRKKVETGSCSLIAVRVIDESSSRCRYEDRKASMDGNARRRTPSIEEHLDLSPRHGSEQACERERRKVREEEVVSSKRAVVDTCRAPSALTGYGEKEVEALGKDLSKLEDTAIIRYGESQEREDEEVEAASISFLQISR
ncbi:hypothetical protein CBR_g16083 [Chara braunii]|uniref:Uncharacterized protein n=1 Tax=Chara braunii TaxID=69332 RepID=A0A388KTK5_CHABU|nr:hypothetical protein CBR_g16083 [Chara braunii]|eukprot:GBG73369.1 hypothetical protein CBR_g16083 [Chara braunii]